MNILIGTILIWAGAVWALARVNRDHRSELRTIWQISLDTFLFMLPRLLLGMLSAGFLALLLPEDYVQRFLGESSGLTGLLIASLFGALTPGGPFVAFAIGASAIKAGATLGAITAYVTAWCIYSILRIISYELPMLGAAFTRTRLLVSLPVPILLGLLAPVVM
ncbi:Predicted permease [Pseudooceanicola antarcticus]|uniref:Permease n=1 Tax=Pseudooceanicola antarcticus TaxID=1247613 RepID=A0A285HVD9_9RHOB|nr:permease [Pseudooceanicola antarcticus]PJE27447.1 permease [Pseudooceanicola antarcticus]SNY39659.1 Predicted permease [Pseudooceanicola antarcticus]